MATPTDPTFGADFDADLFRSAITSTMEMGMANGEYQAVFFWNQKAQYGDEGSVPYDLDSAPSSLTQAATTLTVPVAVETGAGLDQSKNSSIGQLDKGQVALTLLDTHWEQVKTADGVTFDGVDYTFDFTQPVVGLFSVNIHTIICSAIDEAV